MGNPLGSVGSESKVQFRHRGRSLLKRKKEGRHVGKQRIFYFRHGTFGAEFKFLMSPHDMSSVSVMIMRCHLATPSNGFVDCSSVGRVFVFKPIVFCHVLPIVHGKQHEMILEGSR